MKARLSIVAGLVVGVAVAALLLGGILAFAPEPAPRAAATPSPEIATPLPSSVAAPSAAAATPEISASASAGAEVDVTP
jgi:hypothetical protein